MVLSDCARPCETLEEARMRTAALILEGLPSVVLGTTTTKATLVKRSVQFEYSCGKRYGMYCECDLE